ncbi:MAG: AAA family ATPase [Candidatus Krumholzibacteria bacterium]|nr:AAA family ATPase [Candidatus Krumholzibacteria bacterium]
MRTIAVINQKGGCGKTTIAINLAGALTELERRVLLIDMDPQGHASIGLGVDCEEQQVTTYELLLDPAVTMSDAILRLGERLCIVPASTVLSGIEQELADQDGREERLSAKLGQLPDDAFDAVIVDCPPSVGLLTFNALIAVEEALIPIDASFFAMHGLAKLRETLQVLEEELNHQLRVHVVCNNLDTRTHFSKDMLGEVEKFHGGVLFDTFIGNSVRLKEAAAKGLTIFELEKGSKPASQFQSLAREILEKEPRIRTDDLPGWMERLHGPRRVPEGVLFSLDAPDANEVRVTGEFNNWSRGGTPMKRDAADGLWKAVLDVPAGEYEYRFIVDGVWVRDPNNKDYIRNEFGQENSLLIV